MSDLLAYLWLIPVLPLAASVLTAFLGPRFLRAAEPLALHPGHRLLLRAVRSGVLAAVAPRAAQSDSQLTTPGSRPETWTSALRCVPTRLTAIMLVTVTFISSLIAIYSVGYMHGDPGYPRFFAEVALFIFSMTGLVLADNFLLLYAFWEGVGLCSYLLIGFWFTRAVGGCRGPQGVPGHAPGRRRLADRHPAALGRVPRAGRSEPLAVRARLSDHLRQCQVPEPGSSW